MTLKDTNYSHGFCKAAVERGFNPINLAKLAADDSILSGVSDFIQGLSPDTRRALAGATLGGVGSLLLNGRLGTAITHSLIGGLGAYGLSRLSSMDHRGIADIARAIKAYGLSRKIQKPLVDNTKWIPKGWSNAKRVMLDAIPNSWMY